MSGTGLATITGNIGVTNALTSLEINAVDASTNTGGVTLGGNIGVGTIVEQLLAPELLI